MKQEGSSFWYIGILAGCIVAILLFSGEKNTNEPQSWKPSMAEDFDEWLVRTDKTRRRPVIFVESSLSSNLTIRQACSVESAARWNPDMDILLVMTSPPDLDQPLIRMLKEAFGVNIVYTNPTQLFQQVFPKEIVVKWSGKEYIIDELSDRDTVLCLKNAIQKKTGVLPQRQKIIGLMYKSKPVTDELFLRDLNLKPKTKIMMVGSLEENISEVASGPADVPDVVDDFDVAEVEKSIQDRSEFLAKIEKRIRDYDLKLLNQPRPNKHLLVLDIDYTLFDHRSEAQSAAELMRPYLHEFLISAYNDYDIMIWSATSMKWIEAKMKELGVATHQEYKILGYMDSAAMTSIHSSDHGLLDVKPLGVIWGKLPQFTKQNTIMFDDISRNFLMNPQNGLKIRPFRKAHINRYKDRELLYLASYLKVIAKEADLSQLDHRKWERYLEKHSTKPDGS